MRSLAAPVRMFDGMDEETVPKKKVEEIDGPLLTERDKMKLERRKRKDERQREVDGLSLPLSYIVDMILTFKQDASSVLGVSFM